MTTHVKSIDEIEERLHDLIGALREADAPALAEMLEAYGRDFTVQARVRRSVNAIREHLEGWRQDPEALPDSPKVMIAANRLEDACSQGLGSGIISAAAPSFASQWRRLAAIALATVLFGGIASLTLIALIEAGVDVTNPTAERTIGPILVPRGEENSTDVHVPNPPILLGAVVGLDVAPVGGCKQSLRGDATCAVVEARLWPAGRLTTYELKLPRQAYGLLFSIDGAGVDRWGLGTARVLLAATDETPEGRYEIPLTASYLGYTPQVCDFFQRVQRRCPTPRVGQGEKHSGIALPIVIVQVEHGDPARRLGEKRLAMAEAAEARRRAEERAAQIEAALTDIRRILTETEKMLGKRHWGDARTRIQKLASLFAPLEGMVVHQADAELIPAKVEEVRVRFEALRARLQAFETRVFEQTFAAVTAEKNRGVPEASLLRRIAQQFGLTVEDVEGIYTGRADEIERRIAAQQQSHIDKLKAAQALLEQRCGPLPKDSWRAVDAYVRTLPLSPNVEIELGECMTPRLTEHDCWTLRCDYKLKVEVTIERPKVVTKHEANFYLQGERVVRHRDG